MINETTIDKLCDMSRLEIKPNDKKKFLSQMNEILSYVESVSKIDTSNVGERETIFEEKNIMKADVIEESFSQKILRRHTKNYLDGYYAVPKVLNKG